MITNITLENFKCFRQVSINPKLLTVLIGPNGTGKSSILQALLLLKQSGRSDDSRIVYQGEFADLRDSSDVAPNFMDQIRDVSISCKVGGSKESGIAYRLAFQSLKFVPAIRGMVQHTYPLGDQYAEYLSLRQGFDAQECQLASNLVYASSDIAKLSEMLKRVTGVGLRATLIPGREVEVKSQIPTGEVNVTGEGFGANSLIHLLHQLVTADQGATVLIEEPEIHLHPKAQAELAEVMAETAKAEDKQIIMTTHSEHLVERLLLLVAEGTLSPDDLAIYSFEKDEKGECFASEIEVLDNGQVEGGLTDFYANNLETLDRRVKALKQAKCPSPNGSSWTRTSLSALNWKATFTANPIPRASNCCSKYSRSAIRSSLTMNYTAESNIN